MSGLLPSTITKWFSSPSSSNPNGSVTGVDASDSSTEDEARDSLSMGQPPLKRLRLNSSASNHFIGINTRSSSTNTESTDFIQNTMLNSPNLVHWRDPHFMSTPIIIKSEESSTFTNSESVMTVYKLKNSMSSGDNYVKKRCKTMFNSFNNDQTDEKEDTSHSDSVRDLNRHSYNKSSLLRSPFYPGQTTYGGAASTSYLRNSNVYDKQNTVMNDTQNNESINVSHSARRIMDLLENYSSPLTDAKRISQYVKPEKSINISSNTSSYNPNCKKIISYKTQELHVPSIASILSIKRKTRLMATTSAARQLIASHSSSAIVSPYPAASNSNSQEKGGSSKLVTKIKANLHKTKQEKFETVVPLNLPTAVLQIDNNNLPKFSFESIVPKSNETILSSTIKPEIPASKYENMNNTSFALVLTEQSKLLPNHSCYTFSEPVTVSNETVTSHKLPVFTFLSPERSVDGSNRDCTKSDSVSSIVGEMLEKNIASTKVEDWKCNDCWVSNKPHLEKCICCGGKKPEINGNKKCSTCNATLSGTLDICSKCNKNQNNKQVLKVKSDSSKWKCQDCLVSNCSDKDNCVCCGGKKPVKSADIQKVDNTSVTTKVNDSKWKCEDCWVSNDFKDDKCVCCGGKNPELNKQESLYDKRWKCDVCLLENCHKTVKCVACLTPKPSTNSDTKPVNNNATPNFKIGSNNLLEDIVKSQSQKWECPFCLVHNENTKSQCVCCDSERSGAPKQTETKFNFGLSPSTIFKFGIDPKVASDKEKIEEKKIDVKETNNNDLPKSSFAFGIPPQTDNATSKEAEKPKDLPTPAFSFGIPNEVQSKPQLNNDMTSSKVQISTLMSESETMEKPQEVPNIDSTSTKTQIPKIRLCSTLFSKTPSSQTGFGLPSTTAPLTLSFNEPSSVSTSQNINNEAKPIHIPTTSIMSLTNFFKPPTSTGIEFSSASIKLPEAPAENSNINLFQKSEPAKTGINFTAPPLFQKSGQQQPVISTPMFPKIDSQAVLNSTLSPFQNSEMPTTSGTLFPQAEVTVTTSISLFSSRPSQISSSSSMFTKSDSATTSLSASSTGPIFSFGMNNQQPASTTDKPKFNFSFGNSNKIGANMYSSTNSSPATFSGIDDSDSSKFGVPSASTDSTNVFSNNSSGNLGGLASGNILGGNGLGATLSSNTLSSLNTGNTLQNNMQLPIAQGTGIFGATRKENSNWPSSNNATTNIFSTTASTNAIQKPAAFSFGNNNMPFNMNNSSLPMFGSNTQSSQNVFNPSNANTNSTSSLFSNPVQKQSAPTTMFGSPSPASNHAPAMGMFGQQNTSSAFGSNTSTFEPSQNSAPSAFNFGSSQSSSVFGFGQQAPQQQSGVYNFGTAPQVQFAVGSAPGAAPNVRRVKKVVRRTTQR